MKKRLIWSVEDSSSINIWLDLWIPDGVTRRPITPRGQMLLTKVSELINPSSGEWDEQLIRDVFLGGRCHTYSRDPDRTRDGGFIALAF